MLIQVGKPWASGTIPSSHGKITHFSFDPFGFELVRG